MSVLICVPTYESISPETFRSIYNQIEVKHQGRPLFDFVSGYGCAMARNKCAQHAIDLNVDYLMFVDSDIELPLDALSNMIEYDADIVLGLYPRKNTSIGQTEVFTLDNYNFIDENNLNLSSIPSNYFEHPRIDVKGGGMGCALIKTSLFKSMKYPYFKYVDYPDGSRLSEDNYFCWQAKEQCDALIQCDLRVRCKHKGTTWLQA